MNIGKRETIEAPWLSLEPVRVGHVPQWLSTPDFYVLVGSEQDPVMRIDVYGYPEESHCFEDILLWKGFVIIGYGECIHIISIRNMEVITVDLESYYGHLYPTDDYLLVASGERLFRFEPDGTTKWKTALIGPDGVVVDTIESNVITAKGEWGPPGGWQDFRIDPITGDCID
jgi:hypothetical protein